MSAKRDGVLGNSLTRRDLLRAGAALGAAAGFPSDAAAGAPRDTSMNCIFLCLVGGPSHVDTWDPKPTAPSDYRGPYGAITTNVPGIRISELFPRMARSADKYALVRSVHHDGPSVHDVGHQLIQTGRLFAEGEEHAHPGCVLSHRSGAPNPVLLPYAIGPTGGNLPHGQTAGPLGTQREPLLVSRTSDGRFQDAGRTARRNSLAVGAAREGACVASEALDLSREPERLRERYGAHPFGESCLLARRLVERGTRFVTVNMFETVFNQTTWDIHGTLPFTPMTAMAESVAPAFDLTYTGLLDDLSQRGLLENTLVVAAGEFGRTPKINPSGGRDHWTHCWTVLFAGGGVRGGQVIGASDEVGAYPVERPVSPAEVAATVYHTLGIGSDGPAVAPLRELF